MCDDLFLFYLVWRIVLNTCRQSGRWLWISLLFESNNHIYHFSSWPKSMSLVFRQQVRCCIGLSSQVTGVCYDILIAKWGSFSAKDILILISKGSSGLAGTTHRSFGCRGLFNHSGSFHGFARSFPRISF